MMNTRSVSTWLLTAAIVVASLTCSSDIGDPDGEAAAVVVVAGNDQVGFVNEPLPDPLVVRVDDAEGQPVEGVTVVWTAGGGGSVSESEVPTGPDGRSVVQRVLGSAAGVVTTTAVVGDLVPVVFTSTVESASGPRLVVATQPSSAAVSGEPLAQQPIIQVEDETGQPSGSGVPVTVSVEGATLAGTTVIETDVEGVVRFTDLALSGPDGGYNLLFSAPGHVSVRSGLITLGAGPVESGSLVITVQPSSAADNGQPLAQQPVVRAEDTSGDPLGAGIAVTASVPGLTLSGTLTAQTDAGGLAHFTDLALSGPSGDYTIVFSASGFEGAQSETVTLSTPSAESGQWSEPFSWPIVPIHVMLLPDGRVLSIGRTQTPHLWDPGTGSFTSVSSPAWLFCAGHALLADGRVLLAGGHITDNHGLPDITLFSATTNSFTSSAPMQRGRWYPTTTVMGNGEVVILAGRDEDGEEVTIPEVWSDGTVRQLTGAEQRFPYYPRAFVAPDGRLFIAGPTINTRYLTVSGNGSWANGPDRLEGSREYGSAVMYDDGKILTAGGGRTTRTAEVIDLNQAGQGWVWTGSMANARRHLNLTVLPTGEVLATGGVGGTTFNDVSAGVHAAEIWNPATGQWRTLASSAITRGYHATSLLLPDGRVLHAGSGEGAGAPDQRNGELFTPPYLLRGARPEITDAPADVSYGAQFRVETPQAESIDQVSFIRLGAATHAFDENQRFQRLTFTADATGLTVTAPSSSNRAPPGHYMVFILNGQAVPSVARIVRIH
jgi:hypothetical protein